MGIVLTKGRKQISKTVPIIYTAPYGGLQVQTPANILDPSFSPALKNVFLRNAEIRSRPKLSFIFVAPDPNDLPIGQGSFMDANGTQHTFCFTSRGLWQLDGNNTKFDPSKNPWVFVDGPTLQPFLPVSWRAFVDDLYWTNGGPNLTFWDGININTQIAATVGAPTFTNATNLGGQYLSELDSHLLLVNVTAQDTVTGELVSFPQRIWWSANGLPNVWDPAVNTSAGFNDFLDVPDILTGIMTIGNVGYIFRSNGITYMSPTGRGLAPFEFDHLWASERGIGNIYPFSIAQYGSFGVFISWDNVYQVSVNSVQPIGGGARDAIMRDLSQAIANPVAAIIPNPSFGYVFLTYQLCIPLQGVTRIYLYSFEDKNWVSWDASNKLILTNPSRIWR